MLWQAQRFQTQCADRRRVPKHWSEMRWQAQSSQTLKRNALTGAAFQSTVFPNTHAKCADRRSAPKRWREMRGQAQRSQTLTRNALTSTAFLSLVTRKAQTGTAFTNTATRNALTSTQRFQTLWREMRWQARRGCERSVFGSPEFGLRWCLAFSHPLPTSTYAQRLRTSSQSLASQYMVPNNTFFTEITLPRPGGVGGRGLQPLLLLLL